MSFIALSFVVNLMWWFKVVIYFYDIETYRIQIRYVDFMIVLWYNNLCFTWFRIIIIKIVQNGFSGYNHVPFVTVVQDFKRANGRLTETEREGLAKNTSVFTIILNQLRI